MIKFFNKNMRNNEGFTLVELLIVIAVLGILAAIMVPRMTGITDSFKIKSDIESAKRIAKQVEVLVLAGDIDVTSGDEVEIVSDGNFGEPFPEAQYDSNVFVAEVINQDADTNTVVVGYDAASVDIGDLAEVDEATASDFSGNTGASGTPLFTKDIGAKIE